MSQFIGPALPPNFKRHDSAESASSDQISSDEPSQNKKTVIEPTVPTSPTKNDAHTTADESTPKKRVYGPAVLKPELNNNQTTQEEDDDTVIGPVRPSSESDATSVYDERLLQRKRQLDQEAEDWAMKKWKSTSTNSEKEKKGPQREEWMLSLPEDRKQMNVTGPRQFSKSGNVNTVDKSWTESPLDPKLKSQEKYDPRAEYEAQKAQEERQLFDNLHAMRGPSLYQAHQQKLQKSKQGEEDNTDSTGYVRPFDREKDLDTRRVDATTRKKLLDSSKLFNDNFTRGSQ